VATAVAEYIHDRIQAKTIFATHYHELTALDERLPAVVNYSVAVKEDGDSIVFLRSLVRGGADRSYGVEVARLAGLPLEVITRAHALLAELERTGDRGRIALPPVADPTQLGLFAPETPLVVEKLRALDPDRLTPIQALSLLAELVEEARR